MKILSMNSKIHLDGLNHLICSSGWGHQVQEVISTCLRFEGNEVCHLRLCMTWS